MSVNGSMIQVVTTMSKIKLAVHFMSMTGAVISVFSNYLGLNTADLDLNDYQLAKVKHFTKIELVNINPTLTATECGKQQASALYYLLTETNRKQVKRCTEERPPADCPNIKLTPIENGVHVEVAPNDGRFYSKETLKSCAEYVIASGELYV